MHIATLSVLDDAGYAWWTGSALDFIRANRMTRDEVAEMVSTLRGVPGEPPQPYTVGGGAAALFHVHLVERAVEGACWGWGMKNCTSVAHEHPGYVQILFADGGILNVGPVGLDFFAPGEDGEPSDCSGAPTNSVPHMDGDELDAFASPVAGVSSVHTGGNVWIDLIELESGAAITVGTDVAMSWPTVQAARRMIDESDETLLDAALGCVWLFEG